MKTYVIGLNTDLPAVVEKLLIGMLTAIEAAMPGTEMAVQIVDSATHDLSVTQKPGLVVAPQPKVRGERLRYRAVVGQEALVALGGEATLKGIMLSHIMKDGPLKVSEIGKRMPSLTRKAIESHVDKLCTSGILRPEAITEAP